MKWPRIHPWIVSPPLTVALCLLFTGCDTQPPLVPVIPAPEFGKIFVTANIDSAQIYVDNINSGKLTPDTIDATAGLHQIRVEKQGFASSSQSVHVARDSISAIYLKLVLAAGQRVALIEDFSNVSCIPCVTSNLVLQRLLSGTCSRSRLVAIKYATNFPSPSDPFYLAAQPFCDSRMAYYHILFAPTLIVDGIRRPTASDSLGIKDSVNASLVESSRFSLLVAQSIAGNTLSIQVRLITLDTAGIDFHNLVLHTVLLEAEIMFASPPGASGETSFHDVMRAMLPSADGEPITRTTPGSPVLYDRQIVIAPAWNASSLQSVAFIQNKQTRIVYQAGSTY